MVGLGVTILPLFDVVFASENATFEVPSTAIGQVPEGVSVFSSTSKLSHNIVSIRNDLFNFIRTLNNVYSFTSYIQGERAAVFVR